MSATDRIRDLLPSLWRPEPEATDLLARLLIATGQPLDRANVAAGAIMQAHWARFADSALTSGYVSAYRKAARQKPLLPNDPAVDEHPYIDDLARLAGLLDLSPFTEPLDGRETVEEFRRRVKGTVRLWKEGLTTREALVEAARLALSGTDPRGVTIEEFADAPTRAVPVSVGTPDGLVGPLDRSAFDPATGTTDARQQINEITPEIDGSMVYGSTQDRQDAVRSFDGGTCTCAAHSDHNHVCVESVAHWRSPLLVLRVCSGPCSRLIFVGSRA